MEDAKGQGIHGDNDKWLSVDDAWDTRERQRREWKVRASLVSGPDKHTPEYNAWHAPNATSLPTAAAERKAIPITTGVLDYFPDAIAEVARVSKAGNDQHNPGQPLHWAKEKSTDHADCIVRHLIERGTRDSDGQRHSAKVAWRALALLQTELEKEREDA